METLKYKCERDRTKLKFYKNEYVGFDIARKAFEEDKTNINREISVREAKINLLTDENRRLFE